MRLAPSFALGVLAALLWTSRLSAQEAAGDSAPGLAAPPPGRIVPRERPYALGLGAASFSWDDDAPYDDLALASLALERDVLRGIRGRAALGYGETTLLLEDPADTRVVSIDLQVVIQPDFGPLRALPVAPYALGGVGSLVVNPVGDERDLPTRAQTQVSWGGGVSARLGDRWEARAEGVRARVRLADPVIGENRETMSIHTMRWEGRVQWLF